MSLADLHVHSSYSAHPSEWFLQRLGTRESYTSVEQIFQESIKNGMTFVTLTDHNCIEGSLILREKYPEKAFTGVESTVYFPEDGCKVHILIYGLSESQFYEIEHFRDNIYNFRDYLKEQNLAYSVAHATYSINNKLTSEHIEKLILLFDVFEGINGSRTKNNNDRWRKLLQNLTPAHLDILYEKHRIEPISTTPWIKGITGGSDDHAGFFIGKTYTVAEAQTPEAFIEALKNKQTFASGRNNDYQGLAFAVYKIAYDFSQSRNRKNDSVLGIINDCILGNNQESFRSKFQLNKIKFLKKHKKSRLTALLIDLLETFQKEKYLVIDQKLKMVYEKLTCISDEFFMILLNSLKNDLTDGDLSNLLKNVSVSLPGIFLSVPFFSSLRHMHLNRNILDDLDLRFGTQNKKNKKILWFTDTINDLNGVTATIKKLGWLAHETKKQLKIVTCLSENESAENLPPNTILLPSIATYTPSFYNTLILRFPSVLKSLELICQEQPDEILISTPGATGLLGLLAARLLNIKSTGIYHTDFTRQAELVLGDDLMSNVLEMYTRWFYSALNEIRVPTLEYMGILESRGFDIKKMSLFRRGIEAAMFAPVDNNKDSLLQLGITNGITLLYTGRLGKEKNLEFLADIYLKLIESHHDVNLILAGDGPHKEVLQHKLRDCKRVFFPGRIDREKLPLFYTAADIFVFPSTSDTFGMSVLEAQSCGLPSIVSDIGGPKEIIINERTGFVAKASDINSWLKYLVKLIDMIITAPEIYLEMRHSIRQYIIKTYDWNKVLDDIMADTPKQLAKNHQYKEVDSSDLITVSK